MVNPCYSEVIEDLILIHQNKRKPKIMLALSSPLFSTSNCWSLEDLITHQFLPQNDTITLDSLVPTPSSGPDNNNGELVNMSKKNNHNAIERNRRKRVNNLYSSLRSLLPVADQKKKLSIPGTVSSVLKYIPELQQEVKRLLHKKEKLLSSISRQEDLRLFENKQKSMVVKTSPLALSVSPIGEREVLVQISTLKVEDRSVFLEALEHFEEEDNGLVLLNVSSFKSFEGKAFNSLHFQVEDNHKVDVEMLREKLLSFYEKTQE